MIVGTNISGLSLEISRISHLLIASFWLLVSFNIQEHDFDTIICIFVWVSTPLSECHRGGVYSNMTMNHLEIDIYVREALSDVGIHLLVQRLAQDLVPSHAAKPISNVVTNSLERDLRQL